MRGKKYIAYTEYSRPRFESESDTNNEVALKTMRLEAIVDVKQRALFHYLITGSP